MTDLLLTTSSLAHTAASLAAVREALAACADALHRVPREGHGAPGLDEAVGQLARRWHDGTAHLGDRVRDAAEQAEEAGTCFAAADRALADRAGRP